MTKKLILAAVGLLLVGAAGALVFLAERYDPDVAHAEVLPGATFTDREGNPVDLDAYAGKVVVLDFWSST
jgi:cytochrome oxidase Cu insertion factor (SCO1/SenC/PrrC family)